MAAKTIIEINGRKYDALTGRIVADADVPKTDTNQPIVTKATSGVIDGFQRPKQKLESSVSSTLQSRKKQQRSQTLARHIVKKPAPGIKPAKAVSAVSTPKRELSVGEMRRKILSKTPAERQVRAETTKQSHAVTRFASTNHAPKPVVTQPIAVAREKVAEAAPMPSAPPITAHTNATHPTTKQSFTHPLAGANAHLAIPPKKRRLHQKVADALSVSPRVVAITAACLSIIVLSGFFAYQRIPNVSMRIAASQAGFKGTIPSTTPAGYAFNGPITYEKNVIVVSYKSNSDDRNFKIVQKPSTWSNEALLANYVSKSNMRYQTYNDKGLTVYVMDSNNAAWIDNGIWYTLVGSSSLSTEQVLAMAASM